MLNQTERLTGGSIRVAIFAAIALIYLLLPNVYPGFWSPNELSRVALARSLVEHHSFQLDAYLRNPSARNVSDLAFYGGHFYSDKAAGMSLLAVPVVAVVNSIAPDASMVTMIVVARWFTVTIPALVALWIVLRRSGTRTALLAIVGLFLGSVVFPQALSFTGHVTSSIAICAAAWLAGREEPRAGRIAIAGLFAGLAVLIDFTMGIAAAGVFVVIAVRTRSVRKLAIFAVCAAAIASVQLAVNAVSFGGPLDFAYHHMFTAADQQNRGAGFFGIGRPRLDAIIGLTFGGTRGMFIHSPFLLFGVAGLVAALRRRSDALEVWAAVACILYLWMNVSLVDWQGGWTLGPRYLTIIYPLLVFLLVRWMDERRQWPLVLLVTWSVLLHLASMLTWSLPPFAPFLPFPALQLSAFLLRHGVFAPTLLGIAAIPIVVAAAIFAIVAAAGVREWPSVAIAVLLIAIALAAAVPRAGSVGERRFQLFIHYMR